MKKYIIIALIILPFIIRSQSVGIIGKLAIGHENPEVGLDIRSDTNEVQLDLRPKGLNSSFGYSKSKIKFFTNSSTEEGFSIEYFKDPVFSPPITIKEFRIKLSTATGGEETKMAFGPYHIEAGKPGDNFIINSKALIKNDLHLDNSSVIEFNDNSQQSTAAGTKIENGIIKPTDFNSNSFSFPQGSSLVPPLGVKSMMYYDTIDNDLKYHDGFNWVDISLPKLVSDMDYDTRVETELNPDEDLLRFYTGGQERWRMNGSFLIPITNGSESDNTAIGYNTFDINSGSANTALGSYSLQFNSSGNYNTAIGSNALYGNSTGNNNVAVGYTALYSNSGNNNTAIGYGTGFGSIGSNNIYIGYDAGSSNGFNDRLFIGSGDVYNALIYGELDNGLIRVNNTLESEEVRIAEATNPILTFERTASGGYDAQIELGSSGDMYFNGGNQLGSLSTNMLLTGDGDLRVFHGGSNGRGIRFTNISNNKYWTLHTDDGSSGQLRLYSSDSGHVGTFNSATGVYTAVSDRRLKENIRNLESVLPSLLALNVNRYNFINNEEEKIGFIAQDIYQYFPEFISLSEDEDLYTLDYAGLSALAIKAIQEQQAIIESQADDIDHLRSEIRYLRNELVSIKNQISNR